MAQKCVQCGKSFTISDPEIEFYQSKGLSLPKRCKDCREQNKGAKGAHKEKRHSNQQQYKSYYVNKGKPGNLAIVIISIVATILTLVFQANFLLFVSAFLVAALLTTKYILGILKGKVFIQEFDTSPYKYTFYDTDSMVKHYVKHGEQTNSRTMEHYLRKANAVIDNSYSLTKISNDNDTIFYNQTTNEFVVIAKAGYVRTYFIASDKYFDKQ